MSHLPAPTAAPRASRIAAIGAATLAAALAAVELWRVYVGTIAGIVRGLSRGHRRNRGELWRQLHAIGNRSIVFIVVTLGFIGMVMAYEACNQLGRITGDYSQVGGQFIRLIVSDFGPTLTAMMLATRVGAGIAAEIGSMKVTEQIDALRMSGVLPIDYLIVPRFLASMIMTLVLSVIGGLVMFVVKAAAYGAAIPIVAGFCGLRARGSSEGVGWATTAAVIGGSFAVIVLDFVISAAALFLTGGDL